MHGLRSLYYCLAPRFDHLVQHSLPDDVRAHAAEFDAALLEAANSLLPSGTIDLADAGGAMRRRLHLPARYNGCGLRSREWVMDAAFIGCADFALHRCCDRRGVSGAIEFPGFLPQADFWMGERQNGTTAARSTG